VSVDHFVALAVVRRMDEIVEHVQTIGHGAAYRSAQAQPVKVVRTSNSSAKSLMVGPTADDEAPEGFTGKFAKTWKDKDPSARPC
jgi:hypothetical protein